MYIYIFITSHLPAFPQDLFIESHFFFLSRYFSNDFSSLKNQPLEAMQTFEVGDTPASAVTVRDLCKAPPNERFLVARNISG